MKRAQQRPDPPRGELTREEYAVLSLCPEFDTCGEQDCPLDALNDIRVFDPGESGCTARRSTRLRLGTSLPSKGLTRREFANTTRYHGTWDAYLEHLRRKASEKGVIA